MNKNLLINYNTDQKPFPKSKTISRILSILHKQKELIDETVKEQRQNTKKIDKESE